MLAGCNATNKAETVTVSKVYTDKPKPIVPSVPVFKAEPVQWVAVTPENAQIEFQKLVNAGKKPVLLSVDEEGYKTVIKNMTGMQSVIEKQKVVIAVYETSYTSP